MRDPDRVRRVTDRGEGSIPSTARRACGRYGCVLVLGWLLVAAPLWASSGGLLEAARSGNIAGVRALLPSSDVNARSSDGTTALLWAAQVNDLELARLLLEAGADPNMANRYGIAPLWLAATNRSPPMVDLLLQHGADATAELDHGETALMAAARAGDADSIRLLAAAGADPNARETPLGETALMWAAGENHAEAIHALAEVGADLDAHSFELNLPPMDWQQIGMVSTELPIGGWTALMFAARQDSIDAVRALAQVGANLDAQDPEGTTALMLAIINRHYDLAAALVELGADPNVADRAGMTALYSAVDMVTPGRTIGRPDTPMRAKRSALDIVQLLLGAGADPDAALLRPVLGNYREMPDRSLGDGATALMRAARSVDVDSMRLLLKAGADPHRARPDGSNALFFVAGARPAAGDDEFKAGRQAIELLVGAGVDVNYAVGAQCQSAVHRAASTGNATVVNLLVEYGGNIELADAEGRTPRDILADPASGRPRGLGVPLSGRQQAGEQQVDWQCEQ